MATKEDSAVACHVTALKAMRGTNLSQAGRAMHHEPYTPHLKACE